MAMTISAQPGHAGVGPRLRDWRLRRRLSQLDLANQATVSARHLSFVETGRSKPSRELVLHLAEHLDVPLRERNGLLLAAGYAPTYPQTPLEATEMAPVRDALDKILAGHRPFPAIVVDRHWDLVTANEPAIGIMSDGVAKDLMAPPLNTLRVSLHPQGLAPRIVNLAQYAAHLVDRLRREAEAYGDPRLAALHDELTGYPGVAGSDSPDDTAGELFVPLVLRTDQGILTFFSTLATFGTARDITVEELAVESFFPADEATAAVLRARWA
ncbi:MAG TPA: helix-turn-helix domain-containing protein [Acidimicrobiales bacterium]|nr:helix-turn-helix domain-containing protein [Acidimicrobiales bacterium]